MTEPRFFKQETAEGNSGEFKRCLPLGVQTRYVTMAPAIMAAELLRIAPVIGEPLFNEAAEYYEEHGTSGESEVHNNLIRLLQMAVVRLACWDSFAELAVMMTDNGIADMQTEKRAYRYQTDALRETLRRQGYEYVNKVLEYCTKHIDTLANFQQSPYYAERKDSVIESLEVFERYVNIGHDFTVFARLREHIDQAEKMELVFRIGEGLYTAIIADRTATRFSPILQSIRSFVAHWAMAEATPFLNLEPTPHGMMVSGESNASGNTTGKVQQAPKQGQVNAFAQQHRTAAERYIGQAVTYCKAHPDIYPEILEIGSEADTEHAADLIDNHGYKTFLVL